MTPRKRGRPQRSEYLTPPEAADWLTAHGHPKIVGRTVSRACDSGTIRCMKTPGGFRRILITDLEDYLRWKLDTLDSRV